MRGVISEGLRSPDQQTLMLCVKPVLRVDFRLDRVPLDMVVGKVPDCVNAGLDQFKYYFETKLVKLFQCGQSTVI